MLNLLYNLTIQVFDVQKGGRVMTDIDIIDDKEVLKRARAAVKLALEKQKILGVPIVEYDRKMKKVYQVYSDGTRVEVPKE